MADERQRIDANFKNVMGVVTNDADQEIVQVRVNAITKRLLVEQAALSAAFDSVATREEPFGTLATISLTLTNASAAYLLPASELAGRRAIVLYNGSDTDMFIGSSAVTASNGILLPSGGTMNLDISAGLYAICGSAGKIINILELK